LSKQTMTTMVRLLERERLVRRERDPDDGRVCDRPLPPRPAGSSRSRSARSPNSALSPATGSANGGSLLSSTH
jgi:hypothetical protein